MRFTRVVGSGEKHPRIVGIRRIPQRYADRQNVDRPEEPSGDIATPGPGARPEPAAVKPASYFMLSLVFSLLLFSLFFVGDRGILQVRRQRRDLRVAQEEVTKLAEENAKLEADVAALKSDPAALEKIARERLQLVKPGEVVIVLPEGWERRVRPEAPKGPTPPAPVPR